MRPYGTAHWLAYYNTDGIMCTVYCISCWIQGTWNKNAKCISFYTPIFILENTPKHALMDASNCTRWHTPSLFSNALTSQLPRYSQAQSWPFPKWRSQFHSRTHSQPTWLTPPMMFPRMLSIALDGTLPSCYTTCSQVCSEYSHSTPPSTFLCSHLSRPWGAIRIRSIAHSQPAWLYAHIDALIMLSSILSSMFTNIFPIALDAKLPAWVTILSQVTSQDGLKYMPSALQVHVEVHSQVHFDVYSQRRFRMHWTIHIHHAWLYTLK